MPTVPFTPPIAAFVNNTAVGAYYDVAGGGAVYVSTTGVLSAIETTFGDNSAAGYQDAVGGAIDTAGGLSLEDVTIADNLVIGFDRGGGRRLRHRLEPAEPLHARRQPVPLYTSLGNVLIADNSGGVDFDYEGNIGGQIYGGLIGTSENVPNGITSLRTNTHAHPGRESPAGPAGGSRRRRVDLLAHARQPGPEQRLRPLRELCPGWPRLSVPRLRIGFHRRLPEPAVRREQYQRQRSRLAPRGDHRGRQRPADHLRPQPGRAGDLALQRADHDHPQHDHPGTRRQRGPGRLRNGRADPHRPLGGRRQYQ